MTRTGYMLELGMANVAADLAAGLARAAELTGHAEPALPNAYD